MNIYIDANVFVCWEKGEFDLPGWLEGRNDPAAFPATALQELAYGAFAWPAQRATAVA